MSINARRFCITFNLLLWYRKQQHSSPKSHSLLEHTAMVNRKSEYIRLETCITIFRPFLCMNVLYMRGLGVYDVHEHCIRTDIMNLQPPKKYSYVHGYNYSRGKGHRYLNRVQKVHIINCTALTSGKALLD